MSTLRVDARGETNPVPEIKKAIQSLGGAGTVETLVDNDQAMQRLLKLAGLEGYGVEREQLSDDCCRVRLTVGDISDQERSDAPEKSLSQCGDAPDNIVVAVGADHMGEGSEELGQALLKGFLFALTLQEKRPSAILFFNGGVRLTCEGSESLEDLRQLEEQGVEILTSGTCLDYYGLTDKLAVGRTANMYDLVEKQMRASLVIRP